MFASGVRWLVVPALVSVFVVGSGTAGGQSVPSSAAATPLQAALAAGEYSLAWQDAARLPGQADRDDAFRQIAAAQMLAGSEQAAAAAAASIGDDRLRTRTIHELFRSSDGASLMPAAGGGVEPDFESLIDLITSTIRPNDWTDNGGTIGSIRDHAGGVFVDAAGVMRPVVNSTEAARLAALRREAARDRLPGGARQTSSLRKISLVRLERELQLRQARGQSLDEEMRTLAGLQRITHVFVYPESGDVVLAGPAGDWYVGRDDRLLAVENDRPVVLLDDLITLLRREFDVGGHFSVSIEPTADGLQRVRDFADASRKTPLAPGGLPRWTNQLRDTLGRQNVVFHGVDAQSRAARTLVEADYHMKLLGIERVPSTLQVPSYFQIVRNSGREPPSLGLLRWWFTAQYDALLTTDRHDVYELRGQGVQLLSEDEFLSARGERVSTGQADGMNREFAENFTKHYAVLAQKYPLYAELQNLFDLALVCAVLKHDGVCERAGWHRLGLADPRIVTPDRAIAPATLDSVANSAQLPKSRVMAVISGGVRVDVAPLAQASAMKLDDRGLLAKQRQSAAPRNLAVHAWWWD